LFNSLYLQNLIKRLPDMSTKGRESTPEEPEEYIVEKILDKRIRGGRVEYYLKWKGYPEEDNTWEPQTNLDCEDLIRDFEETRKRKADASKDSDAGEAKKKKASTGPASTNGAVPTDTKKTSTAGPKRKQQQMQQTQEKEAEDDGNKPKGFDRGLDPERIIGATDSSGELMFLIKWKDSDEADLVPSRIANVRCPQVVIRFYEERLTWHQP